MKKQIKIAYGAISTRLLHAVATSCQDFVDLFIWKKLSSYSPVTLEYIKTDERTSLAA